MDGKHQTAGKPNPKALTKLVSLTERERHLNGSRLTDAG
jgi:hypothetical protein